MILEHGGPDLNFEGKASRRAVSRVIVKEMLSGSGVSTKCLKFISLYFAVCTLQSGFIFEATNWKL